MTDEMSTAIIDDIRKEGKEKSDFSQVVETLLNDKYKRRKTILNDNRQVTKLTTIDVIAQIYDIGFLKQWVNNYAEWRTSGDKGKGRQDIVDISKAHYDEIREQNRELMGMLRGK